jgi:hypothetical protein
MNKFKKIIKNLSLVLVIIIFSSILNIKFVYGITSSTSSATQKISPTLKSNQVDNLKERLATKVAELNSNEKKALNGIVKNISVASFTLESVSKDIKIEMNDDLVIYDLSQNKKTKINISDLSLKDEITVFGDYDKTLDLMKAKFIYIEPTNKSFLSGFVSEIDLKNYFLTVTNVNKTDIIIDFEKYTKAYDLTLDNKLNKSGFSKITQSNFVVAYGTENKKDANRLSADKITVIELEQIQKSPEVNNNSSSSAKIK